MITVAKWIVIFFGLFLIASGMLMLFRPSKAREILRKAGSTNLINYGEITLRLFPAAGMVIYAPFSKFQVAFELLGYFMLGTSFILYFVPKRIHHGYSQACADFLEPTYWRLISPFSFLFGSVVLYAVL